MSQSGTTISPKTRLLKATAAMCRVWNVGSFGIKSLDILAAALLFELKIATFSFKN